MTNAIEEKPDASLHDGGSQDLLKAALVIIAVGVVVYSIVLHLVAPEQSYRLVAPLLLPPIILITLILLRRGRVQAALRMLAFGVWAVVTIAASFAGGLRAPALVTYPLLIVMAGWLLGLRSGIAMAVLTLGASGLFALTESLGVLPQVQPAPALLIWVVQALTFVTAGVLIGFVLRRYDQRFHVAEQLGEELSGRIGDLAAKEAELRLLAESIPALIFRGDRDLRCRYANRRYAEFFGFRQEDIVGKGIADILGEEAANAIQHRLQAALGGDTVRYRATRHSTASGEDIHLDVSVVPERDESGTVVGFYALMLDVTPEVLAEQTLRKQHAFQDALVQAQSDAGLGMIIIEQGRVIHANDAFCRMYGYTLEEVKALPSFLELAHPDDRERVLRNHQRRLNGEQFENSYRISIITKTGERRAVDMTVATMEGAAPRVLVIINDASERVNAELALQESEKRLREAQRIGHIGSWDLDLTSLRITWSDELYRIYERSREDFGGTWKEVLDYAHPDDLARMRQAWRESAQAQSGCELQHRILTPDGRTKHVLVIWEIFRDSEGRPVRALGTAQDVTEQVLAREEIQHLNEKLEARVRERTAELQTANKELESFAYSISHDLRAPLRGIDGFGQLLLEEYSDRLDAQGQDYLRRMRGAAQRMGALIDDILELSRVTRKSMGRKPVDLGHVAADIIDNKAKSDPQRRVETIIAPGCTAIGDAQLLRVLLENLLENAWKYTRTTSPARIEFGREVDSGEAVFFVRDNGVGFDMRYAGRLFGPFQRLHTSEEFEGTGIGLASAARVVHRHGGRIWAEAEPGKGATFRFTLPS